MTGDRNADMLRQCEEMLDASVDQIGKLEAINADLLEALEAATDALGEVDDFGTATGGLNPDWQNNVLDKARAAIRKARES